MNLVVDHLILGAPDLETGMAEAERLLGAAPVPGGSHAGVGTRNALVGLEHGRYLEVLAPDPAQPLRGALGAALADLSQPALVTWAAAVADLGAVAARLTAAGLTTRGPVRLQRTTPAGEHLEWDLLFAANHPFGSLFPFFIDWRGSPHPSRHLAPAGLLEGIRLESPHATRLRRLLGSLDVPLAVAASAEPAMHVTLEAAHGPVRLATVPAVLGLRFG